MSGCGECVPVSLAEIAARTSTSVETLRARHYDKTNKYKTPFPPPQWPDDKAGPRWCWTHQNLENWKAPTKETH